MLLDCAPMEGLTGAPFRRCHSKYFPGVDRYFAPFISPVADHRFTPKELREIIPENNKGFKLVPQILTKNPEDFLWCAGELHAMGYESVNLNAGCPSGTVTAKGKGSAMLGDTEALRRFLGEIFSKAPCPVSVKTRLGMTEPEDFELIMDIYNAFPIDELIIHPRVREDFYKHPVRQEWFDYAYERAKMPLSYNGGIETVDDFKAYTLNRPRLKAVMIGQGLMADPALISKIKGSGDADAKHLKEFHDELFHEYAEDFQSANNAAQRMKELWSYLHKSFPGSEKQLKKIKKARSAEDYLLAAGEIFQLARN